ncbi:hypothetical protein WNY97_20665 [Pseudoalteromonas fuliginea]|uniref:hypothetical protein n=1 Tax=Pseudoalteromonas TaxID=53246 RepID=UPI0011F39DFD|nr:hypothetical protein [Pseudoalteromonas distincta]KAA1162006.1 hypothetical protein EU511_06570 [Pseudoalteromonas distincta]
MFLPLSAWIKATHPLPKRFLLENYADRFDEKWLSWVVMEEVADLYEVNKLNWVSLSASREKTKEYISKASSVVGEIDDDGWLEKEDGFWIKDELGDPPHPCLPIYIITVDSGVKERVVYIGKTKSASRFTGGHSAALKLHAPEYDGLKKSIYRCSIWFDIEDEYVAIDWVEPETLALDIFDSVESQLIYNLQPELNVDKRTKLIGKNLLDIIHIQNMSVSEILNDHFIYA